MDLNQRKNNLKNFKSIILQIIKNIKYKTYYKF